MQTEYQHSPSKANHALAHVRLKIDAQGGLFTLSLPSELQPMTKSSVARDHRAYQRVYDRQFALAAEKLPYDARVYTIKNGSPVLFAAKLSEKTLHDIDLAVIEELQGNDAQKTKRGSISDFSRRSRSRLLRVVARLAPGASGLFVTFTYRKNQADHVEAKAHLDKLLRWLKYHEPEGAFLWRMEYQKRGAIHFHVLAFNVRFLSAEKVTRYWQEMTGDDSYPDVEKIHNRRKAMYYVSKYTAKEARKPLVIPMYALCARSWRLTLAYGALLERGFIYVPYSEKSGWTGRFWGIVNRDKLPLAARSSFIIDTCAAVLHDIRRAARKRWQGIGAKITGFTLFCTNSADWERLALETVKSAWLYEPGDVRPLTG